jgi:o-succinylbenzoate---CoA ligase
MAEIRCMVSEAAQTSLQQPAILTGDREIIYSEFDQYVSGSLGRLRKAGCKPADRVAVSMPNSWQSAVVLMALFRARAVACMVDPEMDPDVVQRSLSGIGCGWLIAPGSQFESSGLNVLKPDDLMASFPETSPSNADTRLSTDQPATIAWSASRAILHSYGNHYYGARGFNHNVRASSGCRWLLSDPLHRMNGLQLLFQCAVSGATLVIPEAQESARSAIDHYGVTHLLLSPAQLEELLNDGFNLKNHPGIRAIVLNEPVPAVLLRRSYELMLPVYRSYSLPETASAVAVAPLDSPPAKRSTSGRVIKHCRVRIAADGEIMVKGQTLCSGYVEGENVRPAVDADGWLATGDTGTLDAEEYLTLLGRK